jgi:CRISPR-associated protein Cas1
MKNRKSKVALEGLGWYLYVSKGCLVVKDEKKIVRGTYPLSEKEIAEVRLKSRNYVSTGALTALGVLRIPTVILTRHGNPAVTLRSLSDDSHVETRICQYEALKNGKGVEVAKQFLLAKIKGENELLRKYGLHTIDFPYFSQAVKELGGENMKVLRNKLMGYEGRCSAQYFLQFYLLFSESIRPKKRKTHGAHEGLNNILNLAYNALHWKVQEALWRAKLEPYLGFLHAIESDMPSLIWDFVEIYRHVVDDFVLRYARTVKLSEKNFVLIHVGRGKKREYLEYKDATEFTDRLNRHFESKVAIARVTGGKRQEIETLIREEATLFAMYLRNEKESWEPRVVSL